MSRYRLQPTQTQEVVFALYRCVACGFACNADVNAAINIAAGHAVTARGRSGLPERMNREPQLALLQY
jgi:putative transposase